MLTRQPRSPSEINLEVAEHPLVVDGSTIHIAVSIGTATRQPPMADIDELLKAADAALYRAKAAGRNTVRHADLTAATTGSSSLEQR